MGARVPGAARGRRGRGRAAAAVYAQRELHAPPAVAAATATASATGPATGAAPTAAAPTTTTATTAATTATATSAAETAEARGGGRQHLGAEPLAPGLRDGRSVDLVVREHHDQQWYVERYGGREDQVAGAVGERARVPRHGLGAHQPPPDDGREADDAAAHPDGRDQPVRAPPAHLGRVRERVGDRPVPIQRDHAQVQYGRGAEQHVQRPPHVARVYAERPVVVEHLVHRAHRHHHQAHQEVGERQRRDEVVGGRVQVPFPDHGDDHQAVAEHGHHAEQHQHHGQREPLAERRPPVVRGGARHRVVVLLIRNVCHRRRRRRRPVHFALCGSPRTSFNVRLSSLRSVAETHAST